MRSEPGAPGAPVLAGQVPLSVPNLSDLEIAYVREAMEAGWVSSAGPHVTRFEGLFAKRLGVEGAASMASGTAALHVALLVAGVRPGEEVLVSSLTFIAPVNAVTYAGAHPVLVDAEPRYRQMDVDLVENFLAGGCVRRDGGTFNRSTGRRVSAILPVHILGHPVDMERVMALAGEHGLKVVEDATESLGGAFAGRPLGTIGDLGCFSFNGNKLVTTGGGGMLVARRAADLERAVYLSTQAKDDPVEYLHGAIGFNYRLTNLQAALGLAQLERLDAFLAAKRRVRDWYRETLSGIPGIRLPEVAPRAVDAGWLYTIEIDAQTFGKDSRALMHELAAAGIQARPFWLPAHRQPMYASATVLGGQVADGLYRDGLSIPCSTGITDAELERVSSAIQGAARAS